MPLDPADRPATVPTSGTRARRPYVPPGLEHLGTWSALTLQQSVPIGPGASTGFDPSAWADDLLPSAPAAPGAGERFLDEIFGPPSAARLEP